MRGGLVAALVALALAPACRKRGPACVGGRIALVAPTAPVGFGVELTVEVKALCAEARDGTIAWRQVGGAPAGTLAPAERGFGLRARTPTLVAAFGAKLPWGIVPLSPRSRGEVVLEATWSDGRGATETHEARVAAAARSRGLPNSTVGAPLYLGGAGWRVEERPAASGARLEVADGVTSLLPDVAGDYRLADGAGRSLTVRAARYDETPLDCGRSGCHGEIARASATSSMTTVLARGLVPLTDGRGAPTATFGAGYPGCALACHATGEPGVADGGFTHVLSELHLDPLGPRAWETVPRPLRRLGGVGCLACHGPGALPEASGRWSLLRADVCATCHDAPPRYGHVAAWRTTAMARADRDPRAAREPACARCHTTWGFLAGARANFVAAPVDRRPPVEVGAVGITCAACHAVHDPGAPAGATPLPQPGLLRALPTPAVLAGAPLPPDAERSRVCLGCHAPDPADGAPAASATALWLGRGGLDPATGRALEGPAPHAAVAGGCVGCHRSGGAGLERGMGHAFVATRAGCATCHTAGVPSDDLAAKARSLWTALSPSPPSSGSGEGPPHARAPRLDRATPRGRAAWNVSLVLEDRAAAVHNAPYARLLLVAAEKALNGRAP